MFRPRGKEHAKSNQSRNRNGKIDVHCIHVYSCTLCKGALDTPEHGKEDSKLYTVISRTVFIVYWEISCNKKTGFSIFK